MRPCWRKKETKRATMISRNPKSWKWNKTLALMGIKVRWVRKKKKTNQLLQRVFADRALEEARKVAALNQYHRLPANHLRSANRLVARLRRKMKKMISKSKKTMFNANEHGDVVVHAQLLSSTLYICKRRLCECKEFHPPV
mmetsp:Transcript_19059/g.34067  ORF Transcript_19059/g.34067 Transcript_19059/m.34067 type:complete len:141 (+) Transcript_19059:873-1295(+)